jgi:hypothetical protein
VGDVVVGGDVDGAVLVATGGFVAIEIGDDVSGGGSVMAVAVEEVVSVAIVTLVPPPQTQQLSFATPMISPPCHPQEEHRVGPSS